MATLSDERGFPQEDEEIVKVEIEDAESRILDEANYPNMGGKDEVSLYKQQVRLGDGTDVGVKEAAETVLKRVREYNAIDLLESAIEKRGGKVSSWGDKTSLLEDNGRCMKIDLGETSIVTHVYSDATYGSAECIKVFGKEADAATARKELVEFIRDAVYAERGAMGRMESWTEMIPSFSKRLNEISVQSSKDLETYMPIIQEANQQSC